jgi:hypothetical protein
VSDVYLREMYAYERCILQEIHAYDRHLSTCMPLIDACLGEMHAYKRYMPVRDACL